MTKPNQQNSINQQLPKDYYQESVDNFSLEKARSELENLKAEERIQWGQKKFGERFVLTTSFGIQSAVLLNMVRQLKSNNLPTIIWVDTGYLPSETYLYAKQLIEQLQLDISVVQSSISSARMEALYGRLWETKSLKDLEKYHLIRKVEPLEQAFNDLKVTCWASGVRGNQTKHRKSMNPIDLIRGRLSIRPLLSWTTKDIFYYMKENNLPQHPLFEKGYSTVGDWHSSKPDTLGEEGRVTRFGGMKEECGIHVSESSDQ
ncbi:phosphoadenylyl-sulfate reductase [Prochlorococcus sp. MIT 1223]|uniref:phosphoadenylyl-sulfate reductase n=1 Tax=Prochlorococcus sp. MIT 1223 TaxID=3096217 RepID=UPI0039C383A4